MASTTSKIAILKYKGGSKSARALQNAIGERLNKAVLSIQPHRVPYLKPTRFLVNWGYSEAGVGSRDRLCKVLNPPEITQYASNKLETLRRFTERNIPCPEWTTDPEVANDWMCDGSVVFARTVLNGNSGRGIVVLRDQDDIPDAPLYTRYIRKKKEFRVHVFGDEVIDIQEKRKRNDSENENFMIRNYDNDFVFCRQDIDEPHDLRAVALSAVSALALDFGAVDIVWNEMNDACYALEVNTAPGLEGTTLSKYVDKIIEVAYG